jgi:hypothetical protein
MRRLYVLFVDLAPTINEYKEKRNYKGRVATIQMNVGRNIIMGKVPKIQDDNMWKVCK